MPLTPAAIANRRVPCEIVYAGEVVHIDYYASRLTNQSQEELQARVKVAGEASEAEQRAFLAELVVGYLAGWDVLTEEDGPPLPLTVEALAPLDPDFLSAVLTAITQDAATGKAKGTWQPARSGATSSPTGVSTSSQAGASRKRSKSH